MTSQVEQFTTEEWRQLEHLAMIELARRDVNTFAEYCFNLEQQDFHREWHAAIKHPKYNPEGHQFVRVFGMRYAGKSIQMATIRAVWEIGVCAELRIKLVTQNDDRASDRLAQIIEIIEYNARVREIFPDLRSTNRGSWTKHKITVRRNSVNDQGKMIGADASIEALGITSTVTGGRADLLIFDDPIDFRNAIQYPVMRQTVKQLFYSVWINLMDSDGRVIFIGTAWHEDDLLHELGRNDAFFSLVYPAIRPDGTALWPGEWSLEKLEDRRKLIGNREFDRQFLCKALSDEDAIFSRAILELNYAYGLTMSDALRLSETWPKFTGVDLAIGTTVESAYSVIFTLAVEPKTGRKLPLSIVRGQFSSPALARMIVEVYDQYRPVVIQVESNGYQEALVQWLRQLQRKLPVKSYYTYTKVDPEAGIPAMAIQLENKQWMIPRGGDHDSLCTCIVCIWLEELTKWPKGHFSDTVMGMWFAALAADRYGKSKVDMLGNLSKTFSARGQSPLRGAISLTQPTSGGRRRTSVSRGLR